MKKMMKAVIASVALLGFGAAYAADMKIAVVDYRQIVQSSSKIKTIKSKLEKQFKARQQKILAMQQELKADMEKATRDAAIMTSGQKSQLQDKIVREKRDIERQGQDFQQDINLAQNKAMQKFFAGVSEIVEQIAKEQHYDIVLQKEGVPYSAKSIDITSKVLSALN